MRATVDRPGLDSQGRTPLIKIRRVRKGDLAKVRDVIEQAFGDFFERQMGTRPRQVFGGSQYVHHRWLMEPWGCFVAEEGDGKIVGAALAVIWGTVGLVGPVAVLTNYQNQDIGQQLLTACQGFFEENKATLEGVATYPNSPKHITLYQKFGYRPKGLVVLASKPLDRREIVQATRPPKPGLALGDTLLLEKGRDVIGFAVVHMPGVSEAPHGSAYVKFLAVDSAQRKPEHLHALLAAVEDMAHAAQLQRVVAPIYTYYWTAYQTLLERGYQPDFTMVRMKRGKQDDYEHPDDLVLDDWR
jgi:ribosomal protein S18 acetylase RimI-like enzyme